MGNNAGGISIVAFVIAVGVSIGYYQYVYVPEVNAKPILKEEILNPPESLTIKIAPGSSNEANGKFFEPKFARVTIGINNKVIWQNDDPDAAHTVTTDNGYVDQINGMFDSLATIGVVAPGETYEFTFTKVGKYPYHCTPHPWMQGEIEVIENFA